MPYPVGMETRIVSFPPISTTDGVAVKMAVRVVSARSFIWEATGQAFLTDAVYGEAIGTAVNIELPVPGQPGLIDGNGSTITDWTYTATYSLSRGLSVPDITFELPSGGAPLVITPNVSRQVFGGIVNTPVPVVGIQGEQGPPGPEGPQGPPGADGSGAADATTLTKGVVQLAGDLAGTAAAPTVPALANKADTVHTHAAGDVTSGTFAAARLPAATTTASGAVELATTAETTTGTDTVRATTPAGVKAVADTKAALSHTHAIADVTGLQTALDGKLANPFADPNADRIVFWDDSASAYAALQVGTPLRLLGTQLDIPLAAVGTVGAIQVSSNAATQLGINGSDAVSPNGLLSTRGRYVDINAQTGTSYTPVATDQGKLVTLTNAAAISVTLPQDSTAAFPVGSWVDFVVLGAGAATYTAGTGATVNPTTSTSRAQYTVQSAIKIAVNTWIVTGDVA